MQQLRNRRVDDVTSRKQFCRMTENVILSLGELYRGGLPRDTNILYYTSLDLPRKPK